MTVEAPRLAWGGGGFQASRARIGEGGVGPRLGGPQPASGEVERVPAQAGGVAEGDDQHHRGQR